MDQDAYIDKLIAKLDDGSIAPAEYDALVAWYKGFDDTQITIATDTPDSPEALKARMYTRLVARMYGQEQPITQPARKPIRALRYWLPYAAAILLVASVVGWWGIRNRQSDAGLAATEILPGGNRATLTLADGTTVDLSSEQQGIIIQDGIAYLDGTEVIENGKWKMENEGPFFNSITTPKGGTYQITLPDGSKVWLNANSTLKYPSRFSGDSREVFLEGEAYFDIKGIQGTRDTRVPVSGRDFARVPASSTNPDGARVPFIVQTSGQTVEVLGTEFNISAYTGDPETKTTLVEGSVRIAANSASLQLVPGELGTTTGNTLTKEQVDTEQYVSWKNGYFLFDNTPLSSIADQLAKWYDIDVVFNDDVRQERFYGMISRDKNLGQVLKMLAKTNTVKFEVKAKRVHISKQ